MHISRRSLIRGSAGLALSAMLPVRAWADETAGSGVTTEQAIGRLVAGNHQFATGAAAPALDMAKLSKLADGQNPWATIVCCSDSRVPPELIFRAGYGELFVVRNAGNTTASSQSLGSVEYSVATFSVPLIIVLGHTDCGAVKAAKSVIDENKVFRGSIGPMVDPIVPAANAVRGLPLDSAIVENIRRVTVRLRSPEQPILYPAQQAGKLAVLGAIFDISRGEVHYIDVPPGVFLPATAATQH